MFILSNSINKIFLTINYSRRALSVAERKRAVPCPDDAHWVSAAMPSVRKTGRGPGCREGLKGYFVVVAVLS
jgi:hypothetical protein